MRTFAHRYSCFVAETKVTKKAGTSSEISACFLSQLTKALADTNKKKLKNPIALSLVISYLCNFIFERKNIS
jgi:hypothetical protein